jgi:hypothetical protein
LQIADGNAVLWLAAQRAHVDGTDVEGLAELVEGGLRFGVERLFFVGELDAFLPGDC